jgi:hypothetical protein
MQEAHSKEPRTRSGALSSQRRSRWLPAARVGAAPVALQFVADLCVRVGAEHLAIGGNDGGRGCRGGCRVAHVARGQDRTRGKSRETGCGNQDLESSRHGMPRMVANTAFGGSFEANVKVRTKRQEKDFGGSLERAISPCRDVARRSNKSMDKTCKRFRNRQKVDRNNPFTRFLFATCA